MKVIIKMRIILKKRGLDGGISFWGNSFESEGIPVLAEIASNPNMPTAEAVDPHTVSCL